MQTTFDRRRFLRYSSATATASLIGASVVARGQEATEIRWLDVRDWGVEGKGWPQSETEKYFDRLPARAKGVVRDPVWSLSRHSAGMLARFRTDLPSPVQRNGIVKGWCARGK